MEMVWLDSELDLLPEKQWAELAEPQQRQVTMLEQQMATLQTLCRQ